MDKFEELLHSLGQVAHISLHPDKNRACLLTVNNRLHIQLEMDDLEERLLVATFICEVPPGKFRESIFRETLKANNRFPRLGTLAFLVRTGQLAFFEYLPFIQLSGEKLYAFLELFSMQADSWHTAIEGGRPGPL